MNRADLIDEIAKRGKVTQTMAKDFLEELVVVLKETLEKGEDVKIAGFGSFVSKVRKGRIGRNPKTGEPVNIPDGKTIKFKASKS